MDMQYRRLGTSGLKVSALSYGAWVTFGTQLGQSEATELMTAAYDAGVNFFDNAEAYAEGQAEVLMGKVLAERQWPRDTWTVSSKVFFGAERKTPNSRGLSRKHVIEACHAALKRLQVDYLDLYFCHRADPETPIEETVRAMNDLIAQGKVLYWGTSEWSAQQIQEAVTVARANNLIPPTMEQPQYNMFARGRVEEEYAPLYKGIGLGTTTWSPLASGLLTGKYNNGIPEGSRLAIPELKWLRGRVEHDGFPQEVQKIQKLAALAEELGTKLPSLAIAWVIKNPHVSTAILGATKIHQLEENLKALEVVEKLDDAIMQRIDSILDPSDNT